MAKPELFLPFLAVLFGVWIIPLFILMLLFLVLLFAIKVAALKITTIFTVAEQRTDSWLNRLFRNIQSVASHRLARGPERMKRSRDGLAGHPKRIVNHLPRKAIPLAVTILFVLPRLWSGGVPYCHLHGGVCDVRSRYPRAKLIGPELKNAISA